MRRSQAEARKIQQEINQLDRENKKLQDHVKDLKTDPSTMECIAREDFGLARPGELIFKTQPRPTDPAHPAASQGCSAHETAKPPTQSRSRAAKPANHFRADFPSSACAPRTIRPSPW